ncbi:MULTISPECIES: amidohydrolase [unclassified Bradyrhizobium]|uniref:amidohydrolase n=1 Tax=Bradyrhizobium sp. USDA 4541 TaxID=2817704 RepID=UPI0020A4653B|nr:amidohydrolase [Bradyrhizobium sp. USDA 4541]MCP1848125.1 putative amidohydrolase YtcJ [Bradyrhizobium sp. USDA 4541]
MKAAIILQGGKIFCGLNEGFVEAVAVANGKILAVGASEDINHLRGPQTETIELDGRVAVPGLNDAHMHLLPLGLAMQSINLRPESGVGSIAEILRRVAAAAATKKPGDWIVGRGYDHNELTERRHPTAEELDHVSPDNPVFVGRTCGHVGVASTQALRKAGIEQDTPNPSGGLIEKRAGKLTGLVAENAMTMITSAMPSPGKATLMSAIERAGKFMLSQGFTSVMDAAVGMRAGLVEVDAYEELARAGRLPLRVWVCLYGNAGGIGDAAHAKGFCFGREVGLLRYGAMKVFADGSAGSLTAAMSRPYRAGASENRGIFIYSDEQMHWRLEHFHRLGYQLAIHAIGDAAIEQVLSGMEKLDTLDNPVRERRHRIEHCGWLTDDQLGRMAKVGIDPVPQPIFIYEFGELYVTNLGQEAADSSYPMQKWLKAGLHPAASSDAPVCTTDPFKNLFTMVTRMTKRHHVTGGAERLTLEEAVHAYTALGAYTQFAENEIGRLAPGLAADIAILSHDIFSMPIERVETDVRCDMTLLAGQIVFDRAGRLAAAAE